jgi:hypothetical protein
LRIARPILAVTTPLGVAWGLYEAWKFGPHLAVLMGLMLAVVGMFVLMTVRRVRAESGRAEEDPDGD